MGEGWVVIAVVLLKKIKKNNIIINVTVIHILDFRDKDFGISLSPFHVLICIEKEQKYHR